MLILLGVIGSHALAKNCGVIGTVYPIGEVDLRILLQQRLRNLQESGELNRLQTQFKTTIQQAMDRPQSVAHLQRTVEAHIRLFDPSIRFPDDIKNANGQIVILAGTIINPLDTVALSETLLFYNADDADQVQWAKRMDRLLKGHDKLILVGGSVAQQQTLFKKLVYFDQNGLLTKRFQLTHVPALISQAGNRLKIEEVLL